MAVYNLFYQSSTTSSQSNKSNITRIWNTFCNVKWFFNVVIGVGSHDSSIFETRCEVVSFSKLVCITDFHASSEIWWGLFQLDRIVVRSVVFVVYTIILFSRQHQQNKLNFIFLPLVYIRYRFQESWNYILIDGVKTQKEKAKISEILFF